MSQNRVGDGGAVTQVFKGAVDAAAGWSGLRGKEKLLQLLVRFAFAHVLECVCRSGVEMNSCCGRRAVLTDRPRTIALSDPSDWVRMRIKTLSRPRSEFFLSFLSSAPVPPYSYFLCQSLLPTPFPVLSFLCVMFSSLRTANHVPSSLCPHSHAASATTITSAHLNWIGCLVLFSLSDQGLQTSVFRAQGPSGTGESALSHSGDPWTGTLCGACPPFCLFWKFNFDDPTCNLRVFLHSSLGDPAHAHWEFSWEDTAI